VEECSDHGESRDWWRRCSDSAERGGRQETVISTSYPKTSPHQISHHQCVDPRIDSLVSPHLESKCSGPLHRDSHPKPANDRVLTSSRAHISSPLWMGEMIEYHDVSDGWTFTFPCVVVGSKWAFVLGFQPDRCCLPSAVLGS
jgi:hypothetical protein